MDLGETKDFTGYTGNYFSSFTKEGFKGSDKDSPEKREFGMMSLRKQRAIIFKHTSCTDFTANEKRLTVSSHNHREYLWHKCNFWFI